MLKDYKWKTMYNSYHQDLPDDFFIPAFSRSKYVKRASAYFTAKALAKYSEGLEKLSDNKGHYSLIVSENISEEDYNQIKKGYELKEKIAKICKSFDQILSLSEQKNLSNLAYFISIGLVDIKIAFIKNGIFHDKFAIFEDNQSNKLYIHGSNNDTVAAVESNYESFDVVCSWLSSDFDREKILLQEKEFDNLWNNQINGIKVLDVPEAVINKIVSFNKGKVIFEEKEIYNNCLLFDLENNQCLIRNHLDDKTEIFSNRFYKIYIKKYVESIDEFNNINIYFPKSPNRILEVYNILKSKKECLKVNIYISKELLNYIDSKQMNIKKRYQLGTAIKKKDGLVIDKFNKYKEAVSKLMVRKLRDKQMWDSFFMFSMKRSSNFSVPGAGKTSCVYAVYAMLKSLGIAERILVIGPLNSFISWKDEFKACFGDGHKLDVLNISEYYGKNKARALTFELGNKELILINYQTVESVHTELSKIVSNKTLLVFDEVHKIKRINGEWAKYCLNVSNSADYVITLTGTPIPNSYCDIYNNLHILYPYDYDDFFGFTESDLIKPKKETVKIINDKLFPFFCRTTKKQLNVPEANDDYMLFEEASEKEKELFNILKQKYRKNKLAFIIRLLQMESNPSLLLSKIDLKEYKDILSIPDELFNPDDYEDIDYVDYSDDIKTIINDIKYTTKFTKTIDLAIDKTRENKTIVIWCIFKDSMRRISNELAERGISAISISGELDNAEREKRLKDFRKGKYHVLVTNPHTLAESISIHDVCHDAIYFEYSYNLVHLLQSKDRIHRLGLPDNQYTQYYYAGIEYNDYSLDKRIYRRLKEKEQNMLDAIDNNILEDVYTTKEDVDFLLNGLL